jgi:hypothetical protein
MEGSGAGPVSFRKSSPGLAEFAITSRPADQPWR